MIAVAKLKNPPFSAILVWKLNRFSRSRVDSVTYKTLLKNKGIRVISINENLDESPSGQLLEGIIESVDEFYSANLGQDIKRGLRENAARGFYSIGRAPYGFRKVPIKDGAKTHYKLEPDPEESISIKVCSPNIRDGAEKNRVETITGHSGSKEANFCKQKLELRYR